MLIFGIVMFTWFIVNVCFPCFMVNVNNFLFVFMKFLEHAVVFSKLISQRDNDFICYVDKILNRKG